MPTFSPVGNDSRIADMLENLNAVISEQWTVISLSVLLLAADV
jgi:hypothetical protein